MDTKGTREPSIETMITPSRSVAADEVIGLLDYTLLNPKASNSELDYFVQMASAYPVAAVCVYANHLPHLENLPCKKACVVNFPLGQQSQESVLGQINAICKTYTVDEIDYVFPWKTYLLGEEQSALTQSKAVIECCHAHQKSVKIIVESGAFKESTRLQALAEQLIAQGCDFLKTSTGHYAVGATLSAVDVMVRAIACSGKNCGIKISGGIAEKRQAQQYIQVAEYHLRKAVSPQWFRIGASRLLDTLIPKI